MLLHIQHETKLTYSEPVSETVFEVRMAPPSDEDQTNLGYRLRITPTPPVTAYRDGFGNRVDMFNVLSPYKELTLRATTIMRTHRRSGRDRLSMIRWPNDDALPVEVIDFLQHSRLANPSPALTEFVSTIPALEGSLLSAVETIMNHVQKRLKYEKKVTSAYTPLSEALELGGGVCQDFSHLFLAASRAKGLPARYVSGYVEGPGELATHAWCQVWAGRNGWIDVDPTRNTIVGDSHVVIAVGRDYADVPPNRGVWRGRADETIAVSVKVEPIERMPSDWSDWSVQAPWLGAAWSQTHTQTHKNGRLMNLHPRLGYRQQQSQQQQ
jgi:transglutaminase-like putative cysteine protease